MRWSRTSLAIAIAGVVLTGCGGDSKGGTTTPSATDSATAPAPTMPATIPTTVTEAGPTVLAARVAGGEVTGGGRREVAVGDRIVLRVDADVDDEVHLHGYDRKAEVAPGAPAEISFTADIPGVFEVELESRGIQVMEIAVR